MKLYEYDEAIERAIFDHMDENGDVTFYDFSEVECLQMEKEQKIESLLLYAKDLAASANAITDEADKLGKRARTMKKKSDSIKEYVQKYLDGEKFSTPKVAVTYRTSKSLEYENKEEAFSYMKQYHFELLTQKEPEMTKTAVKKLIDSGEHVPGAFIETKTNMVVK